MSQKKDCIPSACRSSEAKLWNAVQDNDSNQIISLLDDEPNLLSHRYVEVHKTVLEAACAGHLPTVTPETVRLLINLEADLEQPNEYFDDMRVIHFAAEGTNVHILTEVMDGMKKNRVDCNLPTSHGNTALLHLLKNGDVDNQEQLVKCVQLLSEEIDVNCVDNKGKPAVYIAAQEDWKHIVDILKKYKLDVDTYIDVGSQKTARDLIVEKGWYSSNDFPQYCHSEDSVLISKINSKNLTEEDLQTLEDVNKEYYNGTLLQMLVQRSIMQLVENLMKNPQLDCNRTTNRNKVPPINIALERGDFNMLAVLLRNPKTIIPNDLLCKALCNFNRITIPDRDYKESAYVCLQDERVQILINKPEYRGNYPLHFACRYADKKLTLSLLEKKASLANRSTNIYHTIAMNDIRKGTLESHLDSCMKIHKCNATIHNDEKEMHFDFTTLLPTVEKSFESKIDIPAENGNSSYHGIDTTLLAINRTNKYEMNAPIFISQSAELKRLLTHPILAMFINLKWQEVSRIHNINLGFYIMLCAFLYAYIFLNYVNADYKNYEGVVITIISTVTHAATVICLIGLILREIFQVCLEGWRYFNWKNIENYIEVFLIIIMSIIIMVPLLNNDTSSRKQVAALAILLSGIDLFLLVGKSPKRSTNTVILQSVSIAFLKLLIWYSILIGAFALSFYTLFSGEDEKKGDDPNFFNNPALSTIKTIIMLTGEFDAGNINFDSIPVVSHIIFLMFVFMISIVLFNLMNGLAVTDTQIIKNESEMYGYIAQVQYIAYIERLRWNHKFNNFLTRFFRPSCFKSDGQHILTVPLLQGTKWYGHFKGSESVKVKVRKSLIKRAKRIVEERKIEKQAKIAQDAEKKKLLDMEKILQQVLKKLEEITKKSSE